jgi:hypothetical protein
MDQDNERPAVRPLAPKADVGNLLGRRCVRNREVGRRRGTRQHGIIVCHVRTLVRIPHLSSRRKNRMDCPQRSAHDL